MATTTTVMQTPRRPTGPGSFPITPGPVRSISLQAAPPPAAARPSSVDIAAKTITDALTSELRYPDLDNYVGQGISSEYDLPQSPAWKPFALGRHFNIPDQVLEVSNLAQVATKLELFAEIQHAVVIVDNALYLWNYTDPNPELIGFDEQNSAITAVKLVKPRRDVFLPTITHLLVVATVADIILIGVSAEQTATGAFAITLYSTQMSVPVKGTVVNFIEGSAKTGRIFFSGRGSDDVWELTYQQQERWFANRTAKICHTRQGASSILPSLPSFFGPSPQIPQHLQLVIDDTRSLLYTLSSDSTLCVYHFTAASASSFTLALKRSYTSLQANIAHMVPRNTDLFGNGSRIVSISPIPANESSRLSLQALTNTGCRIFLSTTSASMYGGTAGSHPPTSMQVHHVRFPPRDPNQPESAAQPQSNQVVAYPSSNPQLDATTRYLYPTIKGTRYSPGFSLTVVGSRTDASRERIFLSAPDSGQIKIPRDATQATKYPEFGQWIELGYPTEAIGQVSAPFGATSTPQGFANEMAIQFDQSATEIAILTSTGVQTIQRRRLVDIFAAAVRYGGDKEGREGQVRRFIRMYGRTETAATALAVACGEGSEMGTDNRVANITDPDVINFARGTFIDHGGKPMINENSVLDINTPAVDNVRPSPRHEGMSLYISRIIRSIWRAPVIVETVTATAGLGVLPSVPLSKLQSIQRALNALQDFLQRNKSSIEGLAGPESLGRVSTKQEEVALQGEHRAMNSLVQLISSIIEGIAFVLVLFDERVEEIILSLPDSSRQRARQLTYEGLFCSNDGRDLAKELVKAIVNRNIANGSNVDTVAEALRRRCGSFCSADDVVIFKAQEQVKRASEAGPTTESGRMLLNESLRLFQRVAAALSMEQLEWAIMQYIEMAFYAGKSSFSGCLCFLLVKRCEVQYGLTQWFRCHHSIPQCSSRIRSRESRPFVDPRRLARGRFTQSSL